MASGQRIRIALADYLKAQYAAKMREPDPWEDYEPELGRARFRDDLNSDKC
jgi:hypothetical protein